LQFKNNPKKEKKREPKTQFFYSIYKIHGNPEHDSKTKNFTHRNPNFSNKSNTANMKLA
jgi:hypothetical protein